MSDGKGTTAPRLRGSEVWARIFPQPSPYFPENDAKGLKYLGDRQVGVFEKKEEEKKK